MACGVDKLIQSITNSIILCFASYSNVCNVYQEDVE
jgi:hypothetical protein